MLYYGQLEKGFAMRRPRLILVKHSLSEIRLDVPAAEWALSSEGRRRAKILAKRLAPHHPHLIGASVEPKAQQTAVIVSEELGKPMEIFEGIHEQERSSRELSSSEEAFEKEVAKLFARPDELVYGEETASQALRRFRSAVDGVVDAHGGEDIALVSHGRVISLYVADYAGIEPFSFWKRLGLPSFVILSLPGREIIEVVEGI
jgi:broad specificity phosphatase PhoE